MPLERGTTLVELLVVLSILTMVMAAGVVAVGTLEARRLDRETTATHEWLKTIRREAMLRGTAYQVLAGESGLETVPRLTSIPWKGNHGIQVVARAENAVWTSLCFFPDGSACPGHLELAGLGGKRRLGIGWLGDIAVRRID